MRITAQSTIAASERALGNLARAPAGEPLRLPINIRHLAGGAKAALAQVIVSWAQQNPGAPLDTFIESPAQMSDFVRRLPGLVAGLCAEEATGVGRVGSIASALRSAALARLDQLQSERQKQGYRGASAEIVFADHLGRDTPYLLYLPGGRCGSGEPRDEHWRYTISRCSVAGPTRPFRASPRMQGDKRRTAAPAPDSQIAPISSPPFA